MFGSGLKSPQKKKFFFADFAFVHPPVALVLLSVSVERFFVSRMRDFFLDSSFLSERRVELGCSMQANLNEQSALKNHPSAAYSEVVAVSCKVSSVIYYRPGVKC